MKWPLLAIILVFFLIVIAPIALVFGIRYLPGGVQPSLNNTISVYQSVIISQSFIAPQDNLTGIGTSIKNPNFTNKENLIVNIYDEGSILIKTVTLSGKNIADGNFVKFFFPPIYNSYGKKFTWSMYSPSSTKDNALQLFLTDNNPSWSLDLKVKEEVVDGSLSYITLHKPESFIEVMNLIYGNWIRKLTGDPYFSLIYLLTILTLTTLLVLGMKKGNR